MTVSAATRAAAAQAFAAATPATLAADGQLPAATAIAALARMAGTYYFRSFGYAALQVTPGQVVLSEEASARGRELMDLAHAVLARLGLRIADADVRKALDAGPGRHQPLLDFAYTQPRLEHAFAPLKAQHGLSSEEAGKAAAGAVALLVYQHRDELPPALAFGIATLAFVEGSKTVPWPPAA